MNSSRTQEFCLGISGLPTLLDTMVGGGLYGAHVGSPPSRPALVISALESAVRQSIPVALVSNGSPERMLQRARDQGAAGIERAASRGDALLFSLKESAAKNVFRHGARRFTLELDHFKIPPGALVVFDGADELFTLQDPFVAAEQIRVYREWIRAGQRCGLLVFSMLSPSSQFSATYHALLEHLDGAMRLESGNETLEWAAEFWISPTGVVASRTLPAQIEANGTLTVREAATSPGPTATISAAHDEDEVFSLDSTLVGLADHAKGRWTFVDNLVALLHASRNAVAATVILVYDRSTELRQLAQAVHTLRVALGSRMRLVVRELDASLRYQNELLLLNLGVNLVIHRDVPVSRFQLALESLKGQSFNREVKDDFEAALASVMPAKRQGYLPPALFAREVGEILARSRELGVPYALVVLAAPQDMTPEALIERFKVTRAGDLMTVVGREIFVFLSACPQINLLPTLQRVAGQSVEEEFPSMRFAIKEREVETDLAAIALVSAASGGEPQPSAPQL